MDAIVRDCYFVRSCEGSRLAPEEQVIVSREKCVRPDLTDGMPRTVVVCPECADRGWDEVEGYVVPDTSPDPYDDQMPAESQIYPLDR